MRFFRIRDLSFFRGHIFFSFCLILLSFSSATGESFFNFAEYKLLSLFTLPAPQIEKKSSLAMNTGLRLSFSHADLRGFFTLPKTDFNNLSEKEGLDKLSLFNSPRIGAGLYLFQKSIPTGIKVGHLTYTKSVSRLKNPSPSTTAAPLQKSFPFSPGIGSCLPTLTSSPQRLSWTLSAKKIKFSSTDSQLEFFFNEDQEGLLSLSTKYETKRFLSLQASFTGGRFFIENKSEILKKNNCDFSGDFYYSGLGEFAFLSPLLKLSLCTGIQECPYDVNPVWIKVDGRSSIGRLLINFSYFFIPTAKNSPKAAPLIGASSTVCRTVEQAQINPQLIFLFDDKKVSSLRIGFSALENWKVTATNIPVQLNTAKFRTGLCYENKVFSIDANWTHGNILLSGNPPVKSAMPEEYRSVSIGTSYSAEKVRSSLSLSYSNSPPLTENSSLKESVSLSAKMAIPSTGLTAQCAINTGFKDKKRYNGEGEFSITWIMRRNSFRSSIKVGLTIPF